jgi:hypothetical protein
MSGYVPSSSRRAVVRRIGATVAVVNPIRARAIIAARTTAKACAWAVQAVRVGVSSTCTNGCIGFYKN